MSKISISGAATGTATFTIESPATSTNRTLTLPDEAGTITTSNSPYSTFRNRIINGDMRIDQRNVGAAVTVSSSFPVDRFSAGNSTDGAFSAQQDTNAPAGFINSFKWTTTTADGTLTTTQAATVVQRIEGTNMSDLAWGTANAKTITLSFWVRSSLTGTFGGALRNAAGDRSYPFTYSISVADTWEYKTVIISGETTGTWLTTNGVGVSVFWGLGVGPDRSGTAGAWNTNNNLSATGAVSVIGTLNATWYITGVQLEVGSVATPFERLDYGRQLIQCQRYYWQMISGATDKNICNGTYYNSSLFVGSIQFPVSMRTAPSLSLATGTNYYIIYSNSTGDNINSFTIGSTTDTTTNVEAGGGDGASGTAGYGAQMRSNNAASKVGFTAEL